MIDLVIGMLIGAVLVLSYLTIHFYLKCKDNELRLEGMIEEGEHE